MERAELITRLKTLKPWLREQGVLELRLVGSHARDQATAESDIDLIARFETTPSLLGLIGLEQALSDALGAPVDLATESGLRPRVRARLDADAVYV